ncbi:MAG: biopolymer transporter ExbD [Phycisphaerae bacterium]|nr:biopolymer transporter ExbD [Phycisphaerae bacterium]
MSLNLAPMIDVTFLLLIFFLLTTTFQRAEGVLGANLPQDRGRPAVALPISPIVIRVESTGPAPSDFALAIDDFAARPASFSELSGFLVDIRQNEGFDEDTPVVIVAGVDTPWEFVVECWNAAVRAGCRRIAFGGEGR